MASSGARRMRPSRSRPALFEKENALRRPTSSSHRPWGAAKGKDESTRSPATKEVAVPLASQLAGAADDT
jgi:hypothetical protein